MESTKSLTFDDLLDAVKCAAAIRIVTRLEPAGGPSDKVFPPTYEGGRYAMELRRTENQEIPTVLLDSVQSQANRMELALLAAYDRKDIEMPLLVTDFSPDFPDIGRITALQAPHRIFDAIFRDSMLDGKSFRESVRGKRLELARLDNATPLLELCPTALIFGAWDSTSLRPGYLGPKFERAVASEIVGYAATSGNKTSSRIDPLQIGSNVKIYRAREGGWTIDKALAEPEKDKQGNIKQEQGHAVPLLWDDGRPSTINHGNVLPSIVDGGVTISHALQTTVLSLIALRRLHFPPQKARPDPEADLIAQTLLASLALCAVVFLRSDGYDLRSRCVLIPSVPSAFEVLGTDASQVQSVALGASEALALFEEAANRLRQTKLGWEPGEIALTPSKELVGLVRKSREVAGKDL